MSTVEDTNVLSHTLSLCVSQSPLLSLLTRRSDPAPLNSTCHHSTLTPPFVLYELDISTCTAC